VREFRPGQLIEARMVIDHVQVLKGVTATYASAEDVRRTFILRAGKWETEVRGRGSSYRSTVELSAGVETSDLQAPGFYQLYEINFETFAGKRITLSIDNDQLGRFHMDTRSFQIVAEPEDGPRVASLQIL
jgi:hypothetical protein